MRTTVPQEVYVAAYVICDITVNDPAAYETYKQLAAQSVEQHGGRYLTRGGKRETLEGQWEPARVVVLEFPDAHAAKRWYESGEYQAAREARRDAAISSIVLVEGL
jgi:uncharacterized protein (DUF1330 family)